MPASVIERSVQDGPGPGEPRRVALSRNGRPAEEWLAWQRRAEGLGRPAPPVEIAFRVQGGRLVPAGQLAAHRVLPDGEGDVPRLPGPGPVPDHPGPGQRPRARSRPTRSWCARRPRCCATCCAGCATRTCSPSTSWRRSRWTRRASGAGSMFRPLFEAVRDLLTAEALIPVTGGGYGVAVDLALAGTGVQELLDAGPAGRAVRRGPARSGSRRSPSPSTSPRPCGVTCGTRSASTRSRPRTWSRA